MANPFAHMIAHGQVGAALGKFMPGQHSPFAPAKGAPKPYEKKKEPVKLGPPTDEQLRKQGIDPKKRKKKAPLTS